MDAEKESCPAKTALLRAWQDATEDYSKAVAELSRNIGIVSKPEYERFSRAAELARKVAIKAKAALDAHTEEHGCDGDGDDEAAA